MSVSERIEGDPEILGGKPTIRGTRLAVEFILELLAAGESEADILENYPGLTREDILACRVRELSRARVPRLPDPSLDAPTRGLELPKAAGRSAAE